MDDKEPTKRPGIKLIVELPEKVVGFQRSADGEMHVVLEGGANFPLRHVIDSKESS